MDDNFVNIHDTRPVYETLQKLKEGKLNPLALSRMVIYQCVEVLLLEGYQVSSIANLIKKSDRTVRRYVKDLREMNALEASPGLTRVLVGELLLNARNQYSRLKQLARMKELSPSEKAKTEFLAWRVYAELIEMMHYVGFLDKGNSGLEINNNMEPEIPQKTGEIEESPKLLSPLEREKMVDNLFRNIMKRAKEIDKQSYNKENEEGGPPVESVI
ncbi:MAG: hypothetical protein NTZ92_08105 [Candidatus Omnitrophica bacterium]|nr:hypothetical protein [Candidatus Omnitrophota bacterium]